MKEYQQKRMKEFVMPETVYRQALWAAKDLPRMKKRIEEMTKQNHMTQNWWWRRLNFVINDEVM